MSNAKLPFPKDKSSNNKNKFFIHKLYHENGITYICMQELCAPAPVLHYVSLTNVPNIELMSPTGATRTAVAFVEKRRKPATTLRSLINCTAHQKPAKLANTPVIAHLLCNLLYRSNNSRLCNLFAYNYCSLRYCGNNLKN